MKFSEIFKVTFTFLLTIICYSNSIAQEKFGNEWINYSQDYFKVKVHSDGIHRITKNNLIQSGINLNNINTIQLFNNGVEQPIYVHTNNNSVEYIEFYGEKNKGSLDESLYSNSINQLNPYYSLYSDTSIYFLTNGNTSGLRYDNITTNLLNVPQTETDFIHEEFISFNKTWNSGTKFLISGVTFNKSFYEIGEGWGSGEVIQLNIPHTLSTNIINQQIEVEMRVAYVGSVNHNPIIKVNGNIEFTDSYFGESTKIIKFTTNINSKQLNISIGGGGEKYVIGYVKVKYRKDFDFNDESSYIFNVKSNNQRKFLEISNFKNESGHQEVFLYDLTSNKRIHCLWNNSKVYTDLIPHVDVKKLILISNNENSYITTPKIDKIRFTNYANYNGDLLIIKHKNIQYYNGRDLIIEYAAHKSTLGFNPVVIDIEEVINQFGYGINNHPQSIRNLFKFTNNKWDSLKYIFLIGKGRTYNEVRDFNTYDNIIPTFGHPASDNLFFTENGILNMPVSIGRLSVSNSQEFKNYFDKLVEMEKPKVFPFEQKIIHLSGGANINEEIYFNNLMNFMGMVASDKGYNVTPFSNVIEDNKDLYEEINSGVMLMTYLGHGNPMNIEYEGDSIELYNNKTKYPFFFSLSCKNGSYLSEGNQMSETFTLEKDKGFIGHLGFSTDVTVYGSTLIANEFYDQLDIPNLGVGELIKNSITNLQTNSSIIVELAIHSLMLNGDPTYRINRGNNLENVSVEEPINLTLMSNTINTNKNIKLNIYPNPMFDVLNIDFNENVITDVQIMDLSGKIIKTFKNVLNEKSIVWNGFDDSNKKLNTGIYYITFYNKNEIITTKTVCIK